MNLLNCDIIDVFVFSVLLIMFPPCLSFFFASGQNFTPTHNRDECHGKFVLLIISLLHSFSSVE